MNKFEIARRLEVLAIELDLLKREIMKMDESTAPIPFSEDNTQDAPPYLNPVNYHNAIATINDHPWDPQSVDDYKRYHRLKGRVIATMQKEGRTSVPLKGAEPEWDLGMEGSKGPSCCGD